MAVIVSPSYHRVETLCFTLESLTAPTTVGCTALILNTCLNSIKMIKHILYSLYCINSGPQLNTQTLISSHLSICEVDYLVISNPE